MRDMHRGSHFADRNRGGGPTGSTRTLPTKGMKTRQLVELLQRETVDAAGAPQRRPRRGHAASATKLPQCHDPHQDRHRGFGFHQPGNGKTDCMVTTHSEGKKKEKNQRKGHPGSSPAAGPITPLRYPMIGITGGVPFLSDMVKCSSFS